MNRIRIESEEPDDDVDEEDDEDNINAEIIQDQEDVKDQYSNESMSVAFLQSNLMSTSVEDSNAAEMIPIDEDKVNIKDDLIADWPQEKKPKKKVKLY